MTSITTHRIIKSNQLCFLIPWEAQKSVCPFPHNYIRVGVPRKSPKNNCLVDIQLVRLDNLRKQVDNTTLPKGRWIHLN